MGLKVVGYVVMMVMVWPLVLVEREVEVMITGSVRLRLSVAMVIEGMSLAIHN